MSRLARTASGTPLIGNDTGFVPLPAADPSLTTIEDALGRPPEALPDPSSASASPIPEGQIDFGLPFTPRKCWGIGLNYQAHADDLQEEVPPEPASFLKPRTTVIGDGGTIRLPPRDVSDFVDAEGELGVVIGRTCKDIETEDVDSVVGGYIPVIDCTALDVLEPNPRFLTRAKSFDTFLVIGPWIVTPDEITDLSALEIATMVNDETIAADRVENMAFSPEYIVSFHSTVMTLEPRDLFFTGSPKGGEINPGDQVTGSVDGIGTVSANVVR